MPALLIAFALLGMIFLFAGDEFRPLGYHFFAAIALVGLATIVEAPESVQLVATMLVMASMFRWLFAAQPEEEEAESGEQPAETPPPDDVPSDGETGDATEL